MQVARRDIESALEKKGFDKDVSPPHRYFHLEYKGKKTGIYTYTSHGSKYKVYQDPGINRIKKQLHLDKSQFIDLVSCPIDGEKYIQILKTEGCIK